MSALAPGYSQDQGRATLKRLEECLTGLAMMLLSLELCRRRKSKFPSLRTLQYMP